MDIAKIKKMTEQDYEAGVLMKAVTAVKNEVKDKERVRDVVMSDHFKTLREPLIEEQKKQMKNDKLIEQLQKNQRAITSGFEDLVMLQQAEQAGQAQQTSKLPVGYKPTMLASVENRFDAEDRENVDNLGLEQPSGTLKKKC